MSADAIADRVLAITRVRQSAVWSDWFLWLATANPGRKAREICSIARLEVGLQSKGRKK